MIKRKINPETSFSGLLSKRVSRRNLVKTSATALAGMSISGCDSVFFGQKNNELNTKTSNEPFEEVSYKISTDIQLPKDYDYQVLLRWGDPLFLDSPKFDPYNQSEQSQLKQFGANNDYVGFIPLPNNSSGQTRGLLAVNHEHTKAKLMYPKVKKVTDLTKQQTQVDIAAHGMSIAEIVLDNNLWQVNLSSQYNRRITPYTLMTFSGPAAGSERLKTDFSKDGMNTLGTYGNCAGGITPWGTVLTAEENVDEYFTGDISSLKESRNYQRFAITGKADKSWSKYFARWSLNKNPNELNHVGWIVEIDPSDPNSVPVKKTALGHFKHEGCNVHINPDGKVIAYTGDDEEFEYIYRFVSKNKMRTDNSASAKQHNMKLLDEGVLSVAKFYENGTLEWLPLIYGKGLLNEKNGFNNQGDVVIEARRAADLLGATPMDRPEDIEVNPVNKRVYAMLTKNEDRNPSNLNITNPRINNSGGHILEMIAPNDDHSAAQFKWDMLMLAGNPEQQKTNYHPQVTKSGWLACPDNCTFDNKGNIWVTSDGAEDLGLAEGLWKIETEGANRGLSKRFMSLPIGSELCGPFFTPDAQYLFCAVQHPGGGSTFANPSTRWPDFDENIPPRAAVVVVSNRNKKSIGA